MIKKIPVAHLRLGMFIHDLNATWIHHGFWRQSFMLRREEELRKLQESPMGEVYIDTLRGLDVETRPGEPPPDPFPLISPPEGDAPLVLPAARVTLLEELEEAREIQQEATQVVRNLLEDVRLGRQLAFERLEPMVLRITDSITRNQGALLSLVRLKARDNYTFQHSLSVATLLMAFARSLGLPEATVVQAGMGGMVHDIGKMRVPDEVLNKPGRLTDQEFHVMKSHVLLGLEILERTPGVTEEAYEISAQHHERYQGRGYPYALEGEQIRLLGRMAAIVDTYDAMTATRVYQSATEPTVVLRKLFEWGGADYDQGLVQAFIQSLGIYPSGSLVRLESGMLALVLDQNPGNTLHPRLKVVVSGNATRMARGTILDLADPQVNDRILGPEDPRDWGLDVAALLAE